MEGKGDLKSPCEHRAVVIPAISTYYSLFLPIPFTLSKNLNVHTSSKKPGCWEALNSAELKNQRKKMVNKSYVLVRNAVYLLHHPPSPIPMPLPHLVQYPTETL